MTTKIISGNVSRPPSTKIHEILLFWCLALFFWHWIFKNFSKDVTNIEYLQWSATAVSIIFFSKHILARTNSTFDIFLGASLQRRYLLELAVVFLFSVILGLGCWAGLALIGANISLEWTYSHFSLVSPETFAEIRWLPQWIVLHLITASLVVPITEEIIFRGFILGRLRQKHNVTQAVIISSLIFALFHLEKDFIGAFAHGIIFATLAVRYSSLYAPMLIHGLYNAAVFILRIWLGTFMSVEKTRISSAAYWPAELFCLGIGAVFLVLYWRHARVACGRSREPTATIA